MAESEAERRYPPSVRMVALAYAKSEADALEMLVSWRKRDQLTYEAISERLASHAPSVEVSPSRLAELILEAQGEDRPEKRERPWARREQVGS